MSLPFKLSSLVRALGPALAVALPTSTPSRVGVRAGLLAVAEIAARQLDPRGMTFISVTPDAGQTYNTAQQLGSHALTTGSFVGVGLLVTMGVDRLPLPRPAKAAIIGAAFYAFDEVSVRLVEKAKQLGEQAEAELDEVAPA